MAITRDSRRLIFAILVALMVVGSVNWELVQLAFVDRASLRQEIAAIPDRTTPDYPRFLEEVRARTSRGDVIAIAVPRRWRSGYEYAFYRASYFLAGRTVVPLLDDSDTLHLERIESADFVAAWQTTFDTPSFTPIWRGHQGTLARRVR